MDSQPTVSDVVKRESARQTVALVFGLAGTLATYYLVKVIRDDDKQRYYKMWLAWHGKHWADKQADRFTRLASWLGDIYNGEKL